MSVNGQAPGRYGEYFRRELSVAGTGPVWQNVDVSVSGGTSITGKKLLIPPASGDVCLRSEREPDAGWSLGLRLGRREPPSRSAHDRGRQQRGNSGAEGDLRVRLAGSAGEKLDFYRHTAG